MKEIGEEINHTPERADNNPNTLEITKKWLRPSREFGILIGWQEGLL